MNSGSILRAVWLSSIVLSACQISAQDGGKGVVTVTSYQACMRCRTTSGNTPGKCSNCQAAKSAIRGRTVHVCPKDQAVFPKSQARCTTHKLDLVSRILTYYCAVDKTSSSQAGNCTVCGRFRSKHLLKRI